MSNTLLTPSVFAKMTLMHLGNALNVAKNMSKEVTSEFARKNNKIGDTVSVRKPQRFQVTKGLPYNPQAITDTKTTVTVDNVAGVHFEWDSVERTLSLREASELYAKPAALALASTINAEAAQYIVEHTANCVGTPGTPPADEQSYLQAGDMLIEQGLPEAEWGNLQLIINRAMSSKFVTGVKTLYNPTGAISKQWQSGKMVDSLGYNVAFDQTIYAYTVGAAPGTPLINTAQTAAGGDNAGMSLSIDGITIGNGSLKVGDVFTIGAEAAGTAVHSVHPQTKKSTGRLKQFVVTTAATDSTGAIAALKIFPAITPPSVDAQYANVDIAAANDAAFNLLGTAGKVSPQGLLMHKNAFAFVSVPLANPEPNGVEMVASETDPETGLTLAFIRAFDPVRRVHVNRFDCLYGFGRLYAEMAVRICG